VKHFEEANTPYHNLSDYDTLVEVAKEENYISEDDLNKLKLWKKNPHNPNWME